MCEICKFIKEAALYNDGNIAVIPSPSPATKAHLLVVPVQHFTILEQLPDNLFIMMMAVANKLSSLIFETLNAEGTNIIVRNGVPANQHYPHIGVEVIPRFLNDNIQIIWETPQASDSELNAAKEELLNALRSIDEAAQAKVKSQTQSKALQQPEQQVTNTTIVAQQKEKKENMEQGQREKKEKTFVLPPRIP